MESSQIDEIVEHRRLLYELYGLKDVKIVCGNNEFHIDGQVTFVALLDAFRFLQIKN